MTLKADNGMTGERYLMRLEISALPNQPAISSGSMYRKAAKMMEQVNNRLKEEFR